MSARDTIIGAIIRGLSKSVELKRLLFGLYLLVRLAVKLRSISLSMRTPQLQPPNGCKSSCGISDYSFLERRTLGFKPQLRRRSSWPASASATCQVKTSCSLYTIHERPESEPQSL